MSQLSQHGGVADYFAVLGIGDNLVLKSTHKKIQRVAGTSTRDHDPEGEKRLRRQIEEEEECAMVERFFREVVEVMILTTCFDRYGNEIGSTPQEMSGYDVVHHTAPAGKGNVEPQTPNNSFTSSHQDASFEDLTPLWSEAQTLDADLNPEIGLRASILSDGTTKINIPRKRRVPGMSQLRDHIAPILAAKAAIAMDIDGDIIACQKKFYLGYRRRGADETDLPAISNMSLMYCRIHRSTIIPISSRNESSISDHEEHTPSEDTSPRKKLSIENAQKSAGALRRGIQNKIAGAGAVARAAINGRRGTTGKINEVSLTKDGENHPSLPDQHLSASLSSNSLVTEENNKLSDSYHNVQLQNILALPNNFSEWIIPALYQNLRLPSQQMQVGNNSPTKNEKRNPWSPVSDISSSTIHPSQSYSRDDSILDVSQSEILSYESAKFMPLILHPESLPDTNCYSGDHVDSIYEYIPIIALRRQRVTEEERFHEDPGVVDVAMTFLDQQGQPVMPLEDEVEEGEDPEDEDKILKKSNWCPSNYDYATNSSDDTLFKLGIPTIIYRKNLPLGFADAPFNTTVLDRYPKKDYKRFPMPQEELPMFCYPTGCRLTRDKFQNAPLSECYGFVVKNERGDSIYVSCVSFMEPLTLSKMDQLDKISEKRKNTSLPHKLFWERNKNQQFVVANHVGGDDSIVHHDQNQTTFLRNDQILIGFEEMTVFENKTICLVSRYPFWSAFKQFLTHLQVISGSSSKLPIERQISHLLYSVKVPKPGGQCILVPLPALQSPMALLLPPSKDLPLLDLSFRKLFCYLDAPTVVTLILGFLALEKKLIIMSTDPSLVTDICELLRSLLFPFELCAPYVPRLTQPFMSVLNFPGAIFAGIHDDSSVDGLAAIVRANIPENTAILDVDTGDIDCDDDRYGVLRECWDIIPSEPRSLLVSEIEALCDDAGVTPVEESISCGIEISPVVMLEGELGDSFELLDDRGIRDCFLRFFCSVLGGYERFLLVPDIDFLISGNDWFDTEGFLASIATQSRSNFLQSLISTQLFQSFIQRRTEASDVHCLLFDECLAEFHSSKLLFGRLQRAKSEEEMDESPFQYDLLVDQCVGEGFEYQESDDISLAETSYLTTYTDDGYILNNSGDLVCVPSRKNLPQDTEYVYCIDGNPSFPSILDPELFYPREPAEPEDIDEVLIYFSVLTRSDRELDASRLRRKMASCHRGVQRQRRCLFQLPKLMGSHFLNAWLMCIPSQLSQDYLTLEEQSKIMLRALGALRILRNRQRIVPDEAGYRCLIVACGSCSSDKRIEVVKLFGLLRSDGIFPSAVTLGQYTKAIAEGFGKKSPGSSEANPSVVDSNTQIMGDNIDISFNGIINGSCDCLDGNILGLEDAGRSWRNKSYLKKKQKEKVDIRAEGERLGNNIDESCLHHDKKESKRNPGSNWSPILCSSSFPLHYSAFSEMNFDENFRFIAMWSRHTVCGKCSYIPLDEEIQAGWDRNDEDDESDTITCPYCGSTIHPQLGYKVCEISKGDSGKVINDAPFSSSKSNCNLPSQFGGIPSNEDESIGFVPYISPSKLRMVMEKYIKESGECDFFFEREALLRLDPTIFYNFWWNCCRFSLPLPLPINVKDCQSVPYWCAFAAWDKSIAEEGCKSARKTVISLRTIIHALQKKHIKSPQLEDFIQPIKAKQYLQTQRGTESNSIEIILNNKFPLLSNFSLQSFAQGDWDHADLSSILVPLVEACDKRDFCPIIIRVLQRNETRRKKSEPDLDCYLTVLYLTRYQCTSAFHRFFPATCKACKGYHFWCPHGTVSIFDRMFRDAVDRTRSKGNLTLHSASDISLGFRNVFGHII